MKIKILRSKPLKEVEDEVIDQQLDVTTAPAPQELTYESNPLEFILQKYHCGCFCIKGITANQ